MWRTPNGCTSSADRCRYQGMATWTHKRLAAWQEAMTLAEMVYRLTATFPPIERYGLTAQLRRAAVSIPSNIAEGSGRNTSREFMQFLGIACGSHAELETQLDLADRLGFIPAGAEAMNQLGLVGRLVNGLRKSIRRRGEAVPRGSQGSSP